MFEVLHIFITHKTNECEWMPLPSHQIYTATAAVKQNQQSPLNGAARNLSYPGNSTNEVDNKRSKSPTILLYNSVLSVWWRGGKAERVTTAFFRKSQLLLTTLWAEKKAVCRFLLRGAWIYRNSCTEVVQLLNLSKILYRSGMYRNGHVPNWPQCGL